MFEAIHKPTGRRVSAFLVYKDLEFQGKDKDDFIAPIEFAENAEDLISKGKSELKCIFIHKHKRFEGTEDEEIVSAHFRCIDEEFIENKWITESKEHKIAKQYICDKWRTLKIYDGQKEYLLGDFEVENIKIEKGIGFKRADVLVLFKQPHEIFGKGICFEVQLSLQDTKSTLKRTFDRCAYGYSVTWVWSDQIEKYDNFRFRIIPFREGIDKYVKELKEEYDDEFSSLAKKINLMYTDKLTDIYDTIIKNNNILNEVRKIKETTLEDYKFVLTEKYNELINKNRDEIIKELKSKVGEINIVPIINNYIEREASLKLDSLIKKIDFNHYILPLIKKIELDNLDYTKSKIDETITKNILSCEKIDNLINTNVKDKLPSIIESSVSKFIKDNAILIKESCIKKSLEVLQLDLMRENTIMYIKNKSEIFLEDPETKRMHNINEFSIKKKDDGSYIIKRWDSGESKN